MDVGILCLKLNLLEEARKKLDPNKFDDEYKEHTLETLRIAADAYRGLANLELKEQGINLLKENQQCKHMYAKAL